ncbi:related to cutinase transcription factor 1 beta [Cephalotrichum gorgonifer]|uniref:Related to cutinase transcription factor 1 beta n=1 Tax=Cephalotrichum gorgonifer TaxID=2041049 RepID=A0AAE8MYE7_9PEZI|nr:related to cutinase transcription factor 1 beta [Cephalotrichum gorgonifer]
MESDKVKKRATRACSFCRSRKVRCIVASQSGACTNCQYHEKQCSRAGLLPQTPSASGGGPATPKSCPTASREAGFGADESETSDSTDSAPVGASRLHNKFSRYQPGFALAGPGTSSFALDITTHPGPSAISMSFADERPTTALSGPERDLAKPSCHPTYAFLQSPDFRTILPQDLSFLVSQGCFVVPQRNALDEFMQQYFLHVHPLLPILNEADVWRSYNLRDAVSDDEEKISILFVSLETLNTLGFQSHQESKWAFYRRAKLLYDFGCETCPITKAQGALLLAQSHLIPRPLAGNTPFGSIWLSVAIHFAREANAHRYDSLATNPFSPAAASDLSRAKKLQNTLKRLWWCCIICDRVFPLSSRQDIKITKSNFDFEGCSILGSEDLSDELYGSDVYDPMTKLLLAKVLQKFVELCVALTDVLTVTSILHNHPAWGNAIAPDKLRLSKTELQRWHYSWPELKSSLKESSVRDGLTKESANSVTLFTSLLEMYYHSARQALCHSEILQYSIAASPSLITEATEKSDELHSATSKVTDCIVELNDSKSIRWLPMTAIGCTALPLALHLIDVELLRQAREEERSSSDIAPLTTHKQRQLSILSDAMNTYRPQYYIVDWVVNAVWHIVHLARQSLSSATLRNMYPGLSPTSWTQLLQLMPASYLRLVMTLEMSISHGKLPQESDFPPTLRLTTQLTIPLPEMGAYLEATPRITAQDIDENEAKEAADGMGIPSDFDMAAYMNPLGEEGMFDMPPPFQGSGFVEEVEYVDKPAEVPFVQEILETPRASAKDIHPEPIPSNIDFNEWAERIFSFDSGVF